MSERRRLAGFGAVLVAALVTGLGLGTLVSPLGTEAGESVVVPARDMPADHG